MLADAVSNRARTAWAIAVTACGVALFATHGRMIVVVVLSALLVLDRAVVRRLSWPAAAAALAVGAVGLFAVTKLDHFLITTSYGGHAPDEAGSRLSSLQDVSSTASVLRNVVGQTWYMLVATLALPLLVLSAANVRTRLGRLPDAPLTVRLVPALVVATGGGLLVLSALSFANPERADMFIYGRYVEIVAPPLLALAVAWLMRATTRPRIGVVLVALAAATAVAVGLRETFEPARASNRWDIAALPSPPFQLGASALALAGAAAAFWALLVIAAVRRNPLLVVPVLLVSFVLTTANFERNPLLSGERLVYGSGWTSPGAVLRDASVVSYDRGSYDLIGLYVYQWFAPHTRFVLYAASSGPPRDALPDQLPRFPSASIPPFECVSSGGTRRATRSSIACSVKARSARSPRPTP